jgi:hypothetical protein
MRHRLMEAVPASGADGGSMGAPASGSTHDRLKAFLTAPSEATGGDSPAGGVAPRVQSKAASAPDAGDSEGGESAPAADEAVPPEGDRQESADDGQSGDAQSEDWQPESLDELAEALGWDSDRILNLPASIKIDGKEGKAALRDLIKSYQLDRLHHQKLETLNNDRKALDGERQKFAQERADRLLRLDAGYKTLERALMGEFAAVNWQQLAAENPNDYNARLVQFQQRHAQLQDIAQQIATEQQQFQQQAQAQAQALLEEERKLAMAKIPEWADEKIRAGDKAEIIGYLDGLGLNGKEAFESIEDHRHLLVVRDAWQWQKLQKSKPAVLNKVRVAPKLLKPGSQQSKAASAISADNKDRARLKQTGRVADATKLLKSRLFG